MIELMLVVAIMGVALAMSYPSIVKMVHRAPLTQGLMDMMEGCRKARAFAILKNNPAELRVYSDGRIEVAMVAEDVDVNAAPPPDATPTKPVVETPDTPPPKPPMEWHAQLGEDVGIELIDVNFVDYMGAEVARVRFYPNGTSDEFTVILKCEAERRKISLEVVTGLAEAKAM